MQIVREATIVNGILKWLKSEGPPAKAVKTHGNPYARSGTPDILGCVKGHMFALEVKVPGKKPTAIQQYELDQWAGSGAVVGVVTSVDEARKLLDPIFERQVEIYP